MQQNRGVLRLKPSGITFNKGQGPKRDAMNLMRNDNDNSRFDSMGSEGLGSRRPYDVYDTETGTSSLHNTYGLPSHANLRRPLETNTQ